MTLVFDEICIDAHDITALGAWWADVLGWEHAVTSDGDVVLHNHPYKGASHSPDAAIIMPIFFEGEAGNDADPVLAAVRPAELRRRLIARREGGARYRFDVGLRGEGETPFFDD